MSAGRQTMIVYCLSINDWATYKVLLLFYANGGKTTPSLVESQGSQEDNGEYWPKIIDLPKTLICSNTHRGLENGKTLEKSRNRQDVRMCC